MALLGANIQSEVKAGENRGRTLEHDFVVLEQRDVALTAKGGVLTGKLDWSKNRDARAVAVWVTRGGDLAPVQATGGWLATR